MRFATMRRARARSFFAALVALTLAANMTAVSFSLTLPQHPLAGLCMLAAGVFVGVAAFGFLSRSLIAGVAAHGVVTLWLVTSAYALWDMPVFVSRSGAWVALAAAALGLARPQLHSPAARRAFAPVRYRALFLAGASAAIAMATMLALRWLDVAERFLSFNAVGASWTIAVLPVLALAYAASALAVVRMRAWGVFLAVLTSAAGAAAALAGLPLTALAVHPMWPAGVVALLAATPGVLVGLPVLLARVRSAR